MPNSPHTASIQNSFDSAHSPITRVGDSFGNVLVFLAALVLVVGYYAAVTFLRFLGHGDEEGNERRSRATTARLQNERVPAL